MFWKYAPLISQIDTLMEREDVTLTAILDEDDVLQECRVQNAKLVNFLTTSENLHKLVQYVTEDPPSEASDATKYKYPNIACELLTCDVTEINDALTKDDVHLDVLYTFLKTEEPLNPLTASFYVKVMGMLTQKKSERMFDYIKRKEDFLSLLLYHIGTSAIVDLLVRLLRDPEPDEMKNKYVEWISEQGFVRNLLAGMKPSNDSDKHYHTSQCVCEIITICRESLSQCQENADISILLDSLESSSTVTDLLTYMFEDENPKESVLVNGLRIILMLFNKKKSVKTVGESHGGVLEPGNLSTLVNENDLVRLAQAASNAVEAVLPKLSHFVRLLRNPPKQHYSPMPTTSGTLNPPLGATRICIVSLIDALLSVSAPVANLAVHEYALLEIILDLFIAYPLNSFLHHTMSSIVTTILTSGNPQEESINKLQYQLLVDCQLLERLLQTYENTRGSKGKEESLDNERNDSVRLPPHDGHVAHVFKIANVFNESLASGNHKEYLTELFDGLDEKFRNSWNEFVHGPLNISNDNSRVDPLPNDDGVANIPDIHRLGQEDVPTGSGFEGVALGGTIAFTPKVLTQKMGILEDEFDQQTQAQQDKFESILSNKSSKMNLELSRFMSSLQDDDSEEESEDNVWVEMVNRKDPIAQETVGRDTRLAGYSYDHGDDCRLSGSQNDEDDDSSSDEEDLDSPIVIRQKPRKQQAPAASTHQEAMDVDDSDEWAEFDNRSQNSIKASPDGETVNMDTTQTTSVPNSEVDEGWASFGSPGQVAHADDGNWADFGAPVQGTASEDWADFQRSPDKEGDGDSAERCAGKKRSTRESLDENPGSSSSPDRNNGPI